MGILVLTTALLLYAGLFILLGGREGAFTGFVFYLFVPACMLLTPLVYCVKWIEKEKAEEEDRKLAEQYGLTLRWPIAPKEEQGGEKSKQE